MPVVSYDGLARTSSSVWALYQQLPRWTRIIGWLVGWPLLVPLWLLRGSPARWRSISAGGSFVFLALLWSATCAAVFTDHATGDGDRSAGRAPVAVIQGNDAAAASTATPSEQPPRSPTSATRPDEAVDPPKAGEQQTPSAEGPLVVAPPVIETTTGAGSSVWVVSRIVDGDTVEVGSVDGRLETVRVIGIDAPERGECGFDEAAEALARLVLDQEVELSAGARDDRDRYGRILRYLDVQSVDAGLELIRGRFAIARYDSRDGYGWHDREGEYVAADAVSIPVCDSQPTVSTPKPTPAVPSLTPLPVPFVPPTGVSVQTFKNCDALRQVYPGGVARMGVQGNLVSGRLRPFRVQPVFDDAVYEANRERDGDDDGAACER